MKINGVLTMGELDKINSSLPLRGRSRKMTEKSTFELALKSSYYNYYRLKFDLKINMIILSLKKLKKTASPTNQDDQGRSENESGAAGSSRSSFSSRTVSRLSGLLNRMRKGGGKESSRKTRKVVKEHRIQVR